MDVFYRAHRAGSPPFTADNAWSAPWGETFSADGSRYECRTCDGTGVAYGERCDAGCTHGWFDADRGYSACNCAADLITYLDARGLPAPDDPVVVFTGTRVGTGTDGEPLVVPTTTIRWTTYGAIRAGQHQGDRR